MEKQELLYPYVSDGQTKAQSQEGFPEHWWHYGLEPRVPNSDLTLDTPRPRRAFALVPQDAQGRAR